MLYTMLDEVDLAGHDTTSLETSSAGPVLAPHPLPRTHRCPSSLRYALAVVVAEAEITSVSNGTGADSDDWTPPGQPPTINP